MCLTCTHALCSLIDYMSYVSYVFFVPLYPMPLRVLCPLPNLCVLFALRALVTSFALNEDILRFLVRSKEREEE